MPVIKYHCSKCEHEFELVRPPNKAGDYMPCPKCNKPAAPSSAFGGAPRQVGDRRSPIARGRDLPPWARGQVEAQVRQFVKTGDAVGGHEVDMVTEAVLKDLSASSVEITPANIKILAQKHLSGLDSWAQTARRAGARMDAADKMDEE